MLYFSPPPPEVGVFDPEGAAQVAQSILSGIYQSREAKYSGRLVVDELSVNQVVEEIDLLTFSDFDVPEVKSSLRHRAYVQLLSRINPSKFSGYQWHTDHDGINNYGRPINFNFGSTNHPTEFYVGELDTGPIDDFIMANFTAAHNAPPENLSAKLALGGSIISELLDDAIKQGQGEYFTGQDHVLYTIPENSIHRMQQLEPGVSYAPRFCIEQYLEPIK